MNATLRITDGTTYVDLISGAYRLNDWTPLVSQAKDGGQYKSSPLADGQRLVNFQWDNVIETLSLQLNAACQDSAIEFTQTLRRLLVQAKDYWTEDEQDTPVYIQCRAPDETNTRYALIVTGSLESDTNYFNQPFTAVDWCGNAVMDELPLMLERTHWMSEVPGTGTCVQTSATMQWQSNDWTIHDAGPVGTVFDIIETVGGSLIAADTSSCWRNPNGALANWTQINAVPAEWDVDPGIVYCFAEIDATHLFAACAAGIYMSANDGLNWTRQNAARVGATPNCLIYASDGYLYLTDKGNGVYRSNDGVGAVWNITSVALDGNCMFEDSNGVIYVGCDSPAAGQMRFGWFESAVWTYPQDEFSGATYGDTDVHCFFEPSDGVFILAGTKHQFMRSLLAGNPSFSPNMGSSFGPIYDAVEVNSVYYATDDGGRIWRSADLCSWYQMPVAAATQFYTLCYYATTTNIYAGEAGDIWYLDVDTLTMGRAATCTNEVYAANCHVYGNLTHVKEKDAAAYTDLFPMAGATNLLPTPPKQNDAVLFCITSTHPLQYPFFSLVFDLSEVYYDTIASTITWQYCDGVGSWANLDVMDHTNGFKNTGVNSVHFRLDSASSGSLTHTFDGVVGWWVRALVNYAATANATPPEQSANREIYCISWPYVDVDELEVKGDIPPLLEVKMTNVSDKAGVQNLIGGVTGQAPKLYSDKVYMARRSISRGANFSPYLSIGNKHNPTGIWVSVLDAVTSQITTGSDDNPYTTAGRYTAPAVDDIHDCFEINAAGTIANQYQGTFHMLMRCYQYLADEDPGDNTIRVKIVSGGGSQDFFTPTRYCLTNNYFEVLDFGRINIPRAAALKSSESTDETKIIIQCGGVSGNGITDIYDVILIPTDEWVGCFTNTATSDDSQLDRDTLLDVDSVMNPRYNLRAVLKLQGNEAATSVYMDDGGQATFAANADQRLWFFSMNRYLMWAADDSAAGNKAYFELTTGDFIENGIRAGQTIVNETDGSSGIISSVEADLIYADLRGGTDNDFDIGDVCHVITDTWVSWPETCYKIQAWGNQRYLAARGAN